MKLRKSLFFLSLLIMFSCQEENGIIQTDPDIEKAKNWFLLNEQNLPNTSGHYPAARENSLRFKKRPDWSMGKVHNTSNGYRAVEVALDYDTYLMPSNENPDSGKPNVINSMLLFEIKEGEYKPYLLKIYPENSSTKVSKNDFGRLNYEKIPADFSGRVMVFDWNEDFIGGWQVINGEKTQYIAKTSKVKAQSESTTNGRTTGGCHLITTTWYISVCNDDESYCTDWESFDTDTYLQCDYITPQIPQAPDSGGDPGGGSGGSGEGGSGGYNNEECLMPDEYIQELMVPCDQDYSSLNECEKELVKAFPTQGLTIQANSKKAHRKTIELFGAYTGGNGHNDCADAFRHAYFNALNAKWVGEQVTVLFGNAHECDTSLDLQREKDMDLFNNAIGVQVAQDSPYASDDTLADLILMDLDVGNLRYLSPLGPDNTLLPETILIATNSGCR